MFAKTRGPVYTQSHVIFGNPVDQLVWESSGPVSLEIPEAQFMFVNTRGPAYDLAFEWITLFGYNSGPVHGWEPWGPVYVWDVQGPSLCLGIPGAQFMVGSPRGPDSCSEIPVAHFMFVNGRGPVHGWEPPGPSLYLGMPGAQFMFGSSRRPVNVRRFQGPG